MEVSESMRKGALGLRFAEVRNVVAFHGNTRYGFSLITE